MFKSLIILASCTLIAACAAPQAVTTHSAKPATTLKAEAQKRACENVEKDTTGTLLTTERECGTVPNVEDKNPKS